MGEDILTTLDSIIIPLLWIIGTVFAFNIIRNKFTKMGIVPRIILSFILGYVLALILAFLWGIPRMIIDQSIISSSQPSSNISRTEYIVPTIIVPNDFDIEKEISIGITIARPSKWERNSGEVTSTPHGIIMNFVQYSDQIGVNYFRMSTSKKQNEPVNDIVQFASYLVDSLKSNKEFEKFKFYQDIKQLEIDSEQACSFMYIKESSIEGNLFSIMLFLRKPNENGVVLQWTTQSDKKEELINLYNIMISSIQFIDY